MKHVLQDLVGYKVVQATHLSDIMIVVYEKNIGDDQKHIVAVDYLKHSHVNAIISVDESSYMVAEQLIDQLEQHGKAR